MPKAKKSTTKASKAPVAATPTVTGPVLASSNSVALPPSYVTATSHKETA